MRMIKYCTYMKHAHKTHNYARGRTDYNVRSVAAQRPISMNGIPTKLKKKKRLYGDHYAVTVFPDRLIQLNLTFTLICYIRY